MECDRLWTKYEGAVFAHTRALSRLRIAGYSNDPAANARLVAESELLMIERLATQQAIRKHKAAVHAMGIDDRSGSSQAA